MISNHRNNVLVTQLKKEVNTLSNNFKKIIADEGVDNLFQTSIMQEAIDAQTTPDDTEDDFSVNADAYRKYFNISLAEEGSKFGKFISDNFGNDIYGREIKGMYFNDGSCFAFIDYEYSTGATSSSAMHQSILLDVNCDKGPNKIAYDIFFVPYNSSGITFAPIFGFDYDTLAYLCNKDMINMINMVNGDEYPDDVAGAYLIGAACFARIVHDGWKIDYLK